jgi:hypothetical protein
VAAVVVATVIVDEEEEEAKSKLGNPSSLLNSKTMVQTASSWVD